MSQKVLCTGCGGTWVELEPFMMLCVEPVCADCAKAAAIGAIGGLILLLVPTVWLVLLLLRDKR